MAKLTKRTIDAAEAQDKDYVIWDDDLPGFGLRVFTSGKRSYLIQYRSAGRSRRYTIGQHGVWTPELARKEAKVQLGRVAQGDNPAEERQLDHGAITVKELCDLYLNDLKAGLILGKGGRPKKPTTIVTDTGRIHRHILPLIGTRRVKDLVKADINKVLKDIMAGKTRVSVKTKKLRGKAIVRGGVGTATRTVGLLDRSRASTFIRLIPRLSWLRIRSRATSRACSTGSNSSRPPTPLTATLVKRRLLVSSPVPLARLSQTPGKSSGSRPEATAPD